jgi:hypothetical protein
VGFVLILHWQFVAFRTLHVPQHRLPQRASRRFRQTAAGFIFRADLFRAVRQCRYLDLHFAVWRGHANLPAWQDVAQRGTYPDAQSRRFTEDELCQPLLVCGTAEDAQQHRRPVFFHIDGREKHIERTGGEQPLQNVAQFLWRLVIQVGFKGGDALEGRRFFIRVLG